jgi:uncharacterized membrane protein YecN with MAPEG domain
MSAIDAAALYAGLNLLILLALAILVVRQRIKGRVMFGDGDHPALQRAIRAHGNAVENIPASVAALVAAALAGAPVWAIHAGGALLAISRVLHAQGLSTTEGRSFGRSAGMVGTWIAMILIAGAAVAAAVSP